MYSTTIKRLRDCIDATLLPQFTSRSCIYLDLPHYVNIGDTLITKGTQDFLKQHRISCQYTASKDTFEYRKIASDTIIALQGGGNFGDVWCQHQDFRKKIINLYPDNKIIVMPQTVFWQEEQNMLDDVAFFGQHLNVVICVRDKVSYDIMIKHFKNEILLVPDMAFYINTKDLQSYIKPTKKDALFIKRTDKEFKDNRYESYLPQEYDVHDWPTMERRYAEEKWHECIKYYLKIMRNTCLNLYYSYIYEPYLIRHGVQLISEYNHIYSTRLHGAILSVLLGKPITIFDNSYGKNSSFVNTWLNDIPGINLIK